MGAKDRNKYDHDDDVDVIGEDQSAIAQTVCINKSGSTIPAFTAVVTDGLSADLLSIRAMVMVPNEKPGLFVGITTAAIANDAEGIVQTTGGLENPSWTWNVGINPIFVGDAGVLTQTFDPVWTYYFIAGFAYRTTGMIVAPQPPILNPSALTTPALPLIAAPTTDAAWNIGLIRRGSPGEVRTALSAYSVAEVAALLNPRVVKTAARLATTAQKSLFGLSAIDGVTPVAADRILVKDNTAPSENGIYAAAAGSWSRVTDLDTWAEAIGAEVAVTAGTANAGTTWLSSAGATGTLGTTSFSWVLVSNIGTPQPKSAVLDSLVANGAPGAFGLAWLLHATLAAAKAALSLAKADVGLGSVDNTADTAKPVSTAQQAALDLKASLTYVDNLAAGLDVKASVRAATTANITLSGAQTIDGVSVVAADRVLVKNQTAPAENGIYVAAAGAWARATDMDAWAEVPGSNVWVEEGTANADRSWVCTANAGGTLNTTAITWTQFGGTGAFAPANAYVPGGTDVPVADGGTGASTAAGALTNLGFDANAQLSLLTATHRTGQTTSTAAINLVLVPVPANKTVIIDGYVAARRTGGVSGLGAVNDSALYHLRFMARSNDGVTATIVGTTPAVTTVQEDTNAAGWDVAISVNAENMRVRPTGSTDMTVAWTFNGVIETI